MTDPKSPRAAAGAGAVSDLPEDMVRRIEELHARLTTTDHYTLLEIPRTATRAEIRSAFLRVAPRFHPDRFFGKRLGPYADKMQRIFGHLSIAHDTLVSEEKRAAYDRNLPPPVPGAGPAPPPPSEAGSRKGPPPLPGASAPPRSSTPFPPSGVQGPITAPRPRAGSDSGESGSDRPPMRPSIPSSPEMERAKAQAFAARLGGNAARMRATPVVPFAPAGVGGRPATAPGAMRPSSASNPAIDPKAAAEALRRRYEEKVQHARTVQTSQHVEAAQAAEQRGDFIEAARMYSLALSHSSDVTLKAAKDHAEARAKEQLLEKSVGQAREAEVKKDYAEAAICWARSFDLAPNAEAAHRAAAAFRRAGSDPRRGARYGEEAVKLDPNKALYRVTLALLYSDAGLLLRARGELDRAHALEPNSPIVKEALARLKGK
jgi:hypothetical protein